MPIEECQSDCDEISNLKRKLSYFESEEGRISGLSYTPKSSDEVIISTSPKAGTTWLQQICHQIRCASKGGDMNFQEISEVVPWLELANDQGQNLYDPQWGHEVGIPRVFKTHAWEPHCPKGCKVIVMFRDPYDVVLSFYSFFEDWFFPAGTITIEQFTREFWLARGIPMSKMQNASYFHHLLSWYERRKDPNVLILFYENLKKDLYSEVKKICSFMSNAKHNFTSDDIVKQVVSMSTYEYMSLHKEKFDEKLSKIARNEVCGLQKLAGMASSKVNQGIIGSGIRKLPPSLISDINTTWKSIIETGLGFKSYDDLRRSMLHN